MEGRALTFLAPRRIDIRPVEVHLPTDGEVLVRTRWSGISGGTELLAYRGELDPELVLDESIDSLDGTFRYPFTYGYACVGEVLRSGVAGIVDGSSVFAFHPHQDLFTVRGEDVVPIGEVDERLATMFPLVETALQVCLDAEPRLGEVVAVVGLGPVGVLTAALLRRSGAEVVASEPRSRRRQAAAAFGVAAARLEGHPGIWVDGEHKLAAIGVRVKRGVTTHGLALNVNTDLRWFDEMIPCGIPDKGVTSLARELGHGVPMEDVEDELARILAAELGLHLADGASGVIGPGGGREQ
jgi:threonine dehydrogenase-like Zn-dependent dehydrogenase